MLSELYINKAIIFKNINRNWTHTCQGHLLKEVHTQFPFGMKDGNIGLKSVLTAMLIQNKLVFGEEMY